MGCEHRLQRHWICREVGNSLGKLHTGSIDVGNKTNWSVGGLTTDQKYFFVVTSYTAAHLASGPSNEVSNDALIVTTGGTLTDQRPSIFWYNQATGQLMSWHVASTNVVDTRAINAVNIDKNWQVAGTGDLNGDGFPDIVWRHATLGIAGLLVPAGRHGYRQWLTEPSGPGGQAPIGRSRGWATSTAIITPTSSGSTPTEPSRSGRCVGATVSSTQILSIPKVAVASWKVAGVVDANRDGYADLIFQDTVTGTLATWFLRGSTVLGTSPIFSIPKQADSDWRVQGASDTDGSGVPKILWRHITSGWVAEWTLSGYIVTGNVPSSTRTTSRI